MLNKKSSIMVCDTFKVNILLVSPDKKWIMAGTKDNNDLSPKVFLVVIDSLTSCLCFLLWSVCFLLLHYLCANDAVVKEALIDESNEMLMHNLYISGLWFVAR